MLSVHAYIEVTDPARGIAFYCDGLGLTVKRRLSPRWIELAGATTPIFLLANRPEIADLGTTRAKRDYARHWTPVHLDFVVPDLDAMVARLTALWRHARSCGQGARIWPHRQHGRPVRQRL
jgi:catechol 2,3-dioxygenase-like lactoylglutathione lyase family enzyme